MVVHPIPVLPVEGHAPRIQTVCRSLHVFRAGNLSGYCPHVVAEQHGVGAQHLVAHGVLPAIAVYGGVHHPVVVLTGGLRTVEMDNGVIEIPVNQRLGHRYPLLEAILGAVQKSIMQKAHSGRVDVACKF